jgi:hypothetical protein
MNPQTKEGIEEMIKVAAPKQTAQGGGRNKSLQFLRSTDVPKDGKLALTIKSMRPVEAKDNIQYGDYLLKLESGAGEKFMWPLRSNSVALAALVGLFSEDEKKWTGKKFSVAVSYNPTFESDQLVVTE